MLKKIIFWSLFVIFSLGMILLITTSLLVKFADFNLLSLIFFIGIVITYTYLIHLYSKNEKIIKLIKRTIWYQLAFGLIVLTCFFIFNLFSNKFYVTILIIIAAIILASFFLKMINGNKTHNIILILILTSILGVIFKVFHLPGTGVLITLGLSMPGTLYLFILYTKITDYDSRINRFLNFFKNFVTLSLLISFMGLNFKIMRWPGGELMRIIATPAFMLSMLTIVFLLPVSNFIEWTKLHKQIFYRAVLIPLLYMAIITSIANVYPMTYKKIFFKSNENNVTGFYMFDYEINE